MACQLSPDPSGVRDFLTSTGAAVTVIVESDSGGVHIIAATLNSAPLPVDADGKVPWTAVQGTNLLDLAFAGPDPDEVFRIQEDCGAGDSQTLTTWKLQAGGGFPGGPTRAFRIHAA